LIPQRDFEAPLLSIVVAVINGARDLPRCLGSVAEQSFKARELIVMDGGSTDGTLDIVRDNSDRIAHWESGPDNGVYDAWNKALAHARGDWICFLGCDDYFHDSRLLERMAPIARSAFPSYRLIYGRLNIVAGDGRVIENVARPWPKIKRQFLAGTLMLPHPGTFHHRTLFDVHGNFDSSFRIAGDYDLMLRELKVADALYLDGEILANMGGGGMSSSPQNMYLSLSEIARARTRNGLTAWSPRLSLRRMLALAGLAVLRLFGRRAFNLLVGAHRLLGRRRGKWSQ
jgi:glycosyltransferase involved in cell wall biosynthesis